MRRGPAALFGVGLALALGLPWLFRLLGNVPVMGLAALFSLGVTLLACQRPSFASSEPKRRRSGRTEDLELSTASGLALAVAIPFGWASKELLRAPLIYELGLLPIVLLAPFVFAISYVVTLLIVSLHRRIPLVVGLRIASGLGCLALAVACAVVILGLVKRATHRDPDGLRASGERIASAEPIAWYGVHDVRSLGAVRVTTADEPTTSPFTSGKVLRCLSIHVEDPVSGDRGDLPCGDSVWHFPAERLWLVLHEMHAEWEMESVTGFVAPSFTPHEASPAAFAHDLAPPLSWILSALAGLVIAAVSLAPRSRVLRERLTWAEETRGGIAVLVSPSTSSESGYRESARSEAPQVVPGTLTELKEQIARARLGRWMLAIAAVMLTGMPLFTAAAMGFVR